MGTRARFAFLLLIVAQAAHSFEEWRFELPETFAPARFASGLVSDDISFGFAVLNGLIVGFGVWCYVYRVRPNHPSARYWIWPWVLVSLGNGVTHTTMSIVRDGYFPGIATAPLLFAIAVFIALDLMRDATPLEAI